MYHSLKKLSLMFIMLNIFTFQSLMADMIFYYNAAILPSIVASQNQAHAEPIANHDDATASDIVPVNVDVLGNDTIDEGLEVTVLLGEWDNTGSLVYVNEVVRSDGTWNVEANQSVTFTPSATYAGGGAYINYQITDHDGHSSTNGIYIDYPVLLQVFNTSVSAADITLQTAVDVISGITIENGESVISLLIQNDWDDMTGMPTYGTFLELPEGNWTVVGNEVVFTPSANFGGGAVYKEFQIIDSAGRIATEFVEIIYPTYLIAQYDGVNPSNIEPTVVNVLANDTIADGATVTVHLEQYAEVYTTIADVPEGTWSVDGDNNVTFTPNVNFSGGTVQMWYRIIDEIGRASKSWINIEYPAFVQAFHDDVNKDVIEPANIDVLANDTIAQGSTVTVLIETYENGYPEYLPTVNAYDGTWHVEENQSITFTPNANFAGGSAWINYQITDQDGHVSVNDINIQYPVIIYADFDYVSVDTIAPVNVDVLANDTIADGIIATIQLVAYWNEFGPVYTNTFDSIDGTWTVEANQSITFLPNANFNGGDIWVNYDLTDQNEHVSSTNIHINFPIIIQAEYDWVDSPDIVPVTVDVLANDVLQNGATLSSLLLEVDWDMNGPLYGTSVEQAEGNWTIVDNEIVFTPNSSFAGGYVSISYEIRDDLEHATTAAVTISYPEFLIANYDEVIADDVALSTAVAVLDNDYISPEVTFESIWLANYEYDSNQWIVATHIETKDGNWTVVDNEVVFTPSVDFSGGSVYINYQLRDEEGHITTHYAGSVNITYPLSATSVCNAEEISDLIILNERLFGSDNEDDDFVISSQFFTDVPAVGTLNPFFFFEKDEEFDRTTLRKTEITLIDSNLTWTYDGVKVQNIDGNKTVGYESFSGTYVEETDDSYRLLVDTDSVFQYKPVQTLSASEMETILANDDINITLVVEDTAQLILTKGTKNEYSWYGSYFENYADLDSFIAIYQYNSENSMYPYSLLFSTNGAAITFAEGSSGLTSGTLVEISSVDNTLLTESAGTWAIETINDDGNTYDIIRVSPVLCGYREEIYKLNEANQRVRGEQHDKVGEIDVEIQFSESLVDKLEKYTVENSSVDLNASTP